MTNSKKCTKEVIIPTFVWWDLPSHSIEPSDLSSELLPFKGPNHVVDVLPDEADDGLHRVVVGLEVEVKGTTDEVFRAVGEVELHRCGHTLTIHLDEETVNLVLIIDNQAVAHAVGLL